MRIDLIKEVPLQVEGNLLRLGVAKLVDCAGQNGPLAWQRIPIKGKAHPGILEIGR